MTGAVVQFGGREFAIRPLTLGQLRQLLDVIADLPGKSGGALIDAAAQIIGAALTRCEPGLDSEAVLAMEASLDEINGAVAAILRLAGLAPQEVKPGEAAPVVTGEPGSPAFMAPSPPAAAIPTR
jgi:hypothetical protein